MLHATCAIICAGSWNNTQQNRGYRNLFGNEFTRFVSSFWIILTCFIVWSDEFGAVGDPNINLKTMESYSGEWSRFDSSDAVCRSLKALLELFPDMFVEFDASGLHLLQVNLAILEQRKHLKTCVLLQEKNLWTPSCRISTWRPNLTGVTLDDSERVGCVLFLFLFLFLLLLLLLLWLLVVGCLLFVVGGVRVSVDPSAWRFVASFVLILHVLYVF